MSEIRPSRRAVATGRIGLDAMNTEFLADKLGLWLRVAHRDVVQQVNNAFARHDLLQAEFLILGLVRDNPGCRQITIACTLEIGAPNLARLMEVLAERELIVRRPDPLDKRVNRVSLTPTGQRCLADAEIDYLQVQARLLSKLGPGAETSLLVALKRLAEAHFAGRPWAELRPMASRPAAHDPTQAPLADALRDA